MTAKESFIAAMITLVGTMLARLGGTLLLEKWEARQRAKGKQKP